MGSLPVSSKGGITKKGSGGVLPALDERGLRVSNLTARAIACGLALLVLGAPLFAARLIDSGPITDQIYMLVLRDGEYRYSGGFNGTQVWADALEAAKSELASSYAISSADDQDFAGGIVPVQAGRKAKLSSVAGMGLAGYFSDHWIYLQLSKKLKSGMSYTITAPGIIEPLTFTFNEFSQRNEAIKINHLGYPPQSTAKFAYISMYMGTMNGLELDAYTGTKFHVVKDGTNQPLFTGTINKRKDLETDGPDGNNWWWIKNDYGSYTMADVWECDFTAYRGESGYTGDYRIAVEGLGCSYPFKIKADVYLEPFKAVMHNLYYQRCGIPLGAIHTKWSRSSACCPLGTVFKQSNLTEKDSWCPSGSVTGETYTNIFGGYHDAADWDKYPTHMYVPHRLCLAYELRPEIFTDGELNIPESGNGVPDILDEAAWHIAFCLRMQKADGAMPGGTRDVPEGSRENWHLWAPEPRVTYWFSAAANALAYCMELAGVNEIDGPYYKDVDLSVSNLKQKAKLAYEWAYTNAPNGAPHEWFSIDEMMYLAHAWMFKATGETVYQDRFKAGNPIQSPADSLYPEWPDRQSYQFQDVAYAYLMIDNPAVDNAYQEVYRGSFDMWFTHDRITISRKRGMRQAWHGRMPTICGKQTTPEVFPQAVGFFALGGDKKWLDIIYPSLDYHLGGNEMNMCWMAKVGHRSPVIMQHRSILDNHPEGLTWGSIPYGHNIVDAVMRTNNNTSNANFIVSTCYPMYRNWGDMELWAENSCHSMTNEFTVHQQHALAAFAYGILKDGGPQHVSSAGSGRGRDRSIVSAASPFLFKRTPMAITIAQAHNPSRIVATLVNMRGAVVRRVIGHGSPASISLKGVPAGFYTLDVRDDSGRTSTQQLSVCK